MLKIEDVLAVARRYDISPSDYAISWVLQNFIWASREAPEAGQDEVVEGLLFEALTLEATARYETIF